MREGGGEQHMGHHNYFFPLVYLTFVSATSLWATSLVWGFGLSSLMFSPFFFPHRYPANFPLHVLLLSLSLTHTLLHSHTLLVPFLSCLLLAWCPSPSCLRTLQKQQASLRELYMLWHCAQSLNGEGGVEWISYNAMGNMATTFEIHIWVGIRGQELGPSLPAGCNYTATHKHPGCMQRKNLGSKKSCAAAWCKRDHMPLITSLRVALSQLILDYSSESCRVSFPRALWVVQVCSPCWLTPTWSKYASCDSKWNCNWHIRIDSQWDRWKVPGYVAKLWPG